MAIIPAGQLPKALRHPLFRRKSYVKRVVGGIRYFLQRLFSPIRAY